MMNVSLSAGLVLLLVAVVVQESASASVSKRQKLILFPRVGKRQALIPFPRTGKRSDDTQQQLHIPASVHVNAGRQGRDSVGHLMVPMARIGRSDIRVTRGDLGLIDGNDNERWRRNALRVTRDQAVRVTKRDKEVDNVWEGYPRKAYYVDEDEKESLNRLIPLMRAIMREIKEDDTVRDFLKRSNY